MTVIILCCSFRNKCSTSNTLCIYGLYCQLPKMSVGWRWFRSESRARWWWMKMKDSKLKKRFASYCCLLSAVPGPLLTGFNDESDFRPLTRRERWVEEFIEEFHEKDVENYVNMKALFIAGKPWCHAVTLHASRCNNFEEISQEKWLLKCLCHGCFQLNSWFGGYSSAHKDITIQIFR